MKDSLKPWFGILIGAAPAWIILLAASCEKAPLPPRAVPPTSQAAQLQQTMVKARRDAAQNAEADVREQCQNAALRGLDHVIFSCRHLGINLEQRHELLEKLAADHFKLILHDDNLFTVDWSQPPTEVEKE